jgi:ankyrin repeat protein
VNCQNQGYTPLLYALSLLNKKLEVPIVRLLVENGADLKAENPRGASVLQVTALKGHIEVLDYLLQTEKDRARRARWINEATGEYNWTAAHFAGFSNQFDALNLLIENGASLEPKSIKGMSYL